MRIAEFAPLWVPVPPPKYGGTELAVSDISTALHELGHEVTLFACGGSKTPATLVQVIGKPMLELLGGFSWNAVPAYEFLAFDELLARAGEFDVIHNHAGIHPLVLSRVVDAPIVTTLHGSKPPDFPYLAERFKDRPFVSISEAQRRLAPALNYVATIPHGIDTSAYIPDFSPGDGYLLFIGLMTHDKGVDLAVRAARELGERLVIAGVYRKEDEAFVQKEVFSFVDGEQIRYVGEISQAEKSALFAGAKALLFPSRWQEAFGLVMIESLACGTPVVAFNNGSVPEVLRDGVTGYIVDSFEDFKDRIGNVGRLSREACRTEAETRFDRRRVGQAYARLFEQIV
ncbi:glycosyltransferase family 4 protein [Patescibacteria group bacterium]|nr:MAG: glycosyltransferase family 4 protein [Patescibacteria group bacterium]